MALLLALPAGASDFGRAAVGTAGSEFLLLDTSARGIAMGGALSAATNDAASIYWNPAGLSQVPRFSATFLHSRYISDISYNAAAVARRVNDSSVIAAGVRYLDFGPIKRTDINGLDRGEFHPRSYLAELGWGQSIYDLSDSEVDVAMGVTVKYLYSDIGEKASGYGGDFGVHSRFYGTTQTYDIALAIQNLGVGLKYDKTRDSLPTRLRFGGGVRPIKPLLLTLDAFAPINNSFHVPSASGSNPAASILARIRASCSTASLARFDSRVARFDSESARFDSRVARFDSRVARRASVSARTASRSARFASNSARLPISMNVRNRCPLAP